MRLCAVDGCERTHWALGYCMRHYKASRNGWVLRAPLPGDNHRYCTCYGDDIPTPDPNGMCPACLRLVESRSTA